MKSLSLNRIAFVFFVATIIATPAFAENLKTYVQYDALTGIITGTVKAREGDPAPNHGFFKQTSFDGWVETEGKKVNILNRQLYPRPTKTVEVTNEDGTKEWQEVYADDPAFDGLPEKP